MDHHKQNVPLKT